MALPDIHVETHADAASADPATPPDLLWTIETGHRRIARRIGGGVAGMYLALLVVLAAFGPLIAPYGENTVDSSALLRGPSLSHLLGTDDLGRDVLSRLVLGTRSAILGVALAMAIAVALGMLWGLAAGIGGRIVGDILMRIADAALAFPAIVLAVGVIGAAGPGLTHAMIAVGVIFAPIIARLTRGEVLRVKSGDYVLYARAYGMSLPQTLWVHVIPNVIRPIVVQVTILSGIALIAQAGLSFLGLGAQPPSPNWGNMLGEAFQYLHQSPGQMFAPGLAIVITVLAINAVGDRLRDRYDV